MKRQILDAAAKDKRDRAFRKRIDGMREEHPQHRDRSNDEEVEVSVIIKHETERAYLVDGGMTKEPVWVPKSLVSLEKHEGARASTLTLSERLAKEKGLI